MRSSKPANVTSLRCSMASDSVAPKIIVNDTKSEKTNALSLSMEPIPPNESAAVSVLGNTALALTLKGHLTSHPETPTEHHSPPSGTAPADFYFPKSTRNEAPTIVIGDDHSLSVDYVAIESVVAGISSNVVDSPAFWKKKEYKWSAPAGSGETSAPESLSTTLYEKYYPSNIRNLAPYFNIKAPAGDWDKSAYLDYGTEYVGFNGEAQRMVAAQLSGRNGSDDDQYKNYSGPELNKAPVISVTGEESVSCGMEVIAGDAQTASDILQRN